jgi:hypothetical protein
MERHKKQLTQEVLARYAIKSNDFLSLATLNYDPSGYDYDISQP